MRWRKKPASAARLLPVIWKPLLLTAFAGAALAAEPVGIDWVKARQHWSFVPPKTPALPVVKDRAWPRGRVDHFILAQIEQHDLTPSPEAEPRVLLRRLFFDLTGLPPTPEETRAFLFKFLEEMKMH